MIVGFISYIALLQVLYAIQDLLITIPFVAIVTTVYLLIIQRTLSARKALKSIFDSTGSHTTHERDLQLLLIQQSEQVLRTNLQQFRKVCLIDRVKIIRRLISRLSQHRIRRLIRIILIKNYHKLFLISV